MEFLKIIQSLQKPHHENVRIIFTFNYIQTN